MGVILASSNHFFVKGFENVLDSRIAIIESYTCIVIACPLACSTGQKATINDQLGAGDKGRFI
jgi:hypothetical protein